MIPLKVPSASLRVQLCIREWSRNVFPVADEPEFRMLFHGKGAPQSRSNLLCWKGPRNSEGQHPQTTIKTISSHLIPGQPQNGRETNEPPTTEIPSPENQAYKPRRATAKEFIPFLRACPSATKAPSNTFVGDPDTDNHNPGDLLAGDLGSKGILGFTGRPPPSIRWCLDEATSRLSRSRTPLESGHAMTITSEARLAINRPIPQNPRDPAPRPARPSRDATPASMATAPRSSPFPTKTPRSSPQSTTPDTITIGPRARAPASSSTPASAPRSTPNASKNSFTPPSPRRSSTPRRPGTTPRSTRSRPSGGSSMTMPRPPSSSWGARRWGGIISSNAWASISNNSRSEGAGSTLNSTRSSATSGSTTPRSGSATTSTPSTSTITERWRNPRTGTAPPRTW